jgi:putative ABC transport system substrate-binding protein
MKQKFYFWQMVLFLLATVIPAQAQQTTKVSRIGFLTLGSPSGASSGLEAFRKGLGEIGYVEGRNFSIEHRWAEGQQDRLPGLANDLVRIKVDIIMTSGMSAVLAAKNATKTIPIVFAGAADPIAWGLVASLAQPGGNVTGLSELAGRELEGKRLELLKEAFPRISRVAVVLDSTGRVDPSPLQSAARALGLTLQLSDETVTPDEFRSAFTSMAREKVDALYAPQTPTNVRHRNLIVELATKHRLPAMYGSSEFVEAGGLMSYGAHFSDLFRRAAVYVDKILKGTKPAELPVEQPTKFELIISVQAAKKIRLTIRPELLARADKVIK